MRKLEEWIVRHPELFPGEIERRYWLYGWERRSVEMPEVPIRRICLRDPAEVGERQVCQVAPSFVMPYRVVETYEVEKALFRLMVDRDILRSYLFSGATFHNWGKTVLEGSSVTHSCLALGVCLMDPFCSNHQISGCYLNIRNQQSRQPSPADAQSPGWGKKFLGVKNDFLGVKNNFHAEKLAISGLGSRKQAAGLLGV